MGSVNAYFTRKKTFLIILVQTLIALFAGILAYYITTADKLPANVYIGDTAVGGLDGRSAAKKLQKAYKDILDKGYIEIRCRDSYRIKLSDLDAVLDIESTLAKARGNNPDFLYRMGMNMSNSPKRYIKPAFKVNEDKLGTEMEKLSDYVDRDFVNAGITLKDGKLIKTPEVYGYRLTLDKAADAVRQALKNYMGLPIDFESYEGVLKVLKPELVLSDFEGINAILSTAEIEIPDPSFTESVKGAVKANNGVLLEPLNNNRDNDSADFSFSKNLKLHNSLKDKDIDGYSIVASAVYQAALKAGIPADSITRAHNRSFPLYTQPGIDACISPDKFDLRFGNEIGHKVFIFAGISGDKVVVTFAGSEADIPRQALLQTKVVERYSPPLVREENSALAYGETRSISGGREGLKVNVYLNDRLLYTDIYDPVQAVMQIGPGTVANSDNGK